MNVSKQLKDPNNLLIEGFSKLKIKSNDKLISLDITHMFGKIPKEPQASGRVEICQDKGRNY